MKNENDDACPCGACTLRRSLERKEQEQGREPSLRETLEGIIDSLLSNTSSPPPKCQCANCVMADKLISGLAEQGNINWNTFLASVQQGSRAPRELSAEDFADAFDGWLSKRLTPDGCSCVFGTSPVHHVSKPVTHAFLFTSPKDNYRYRELTVHEQARARARVGSLMDRPIVWVHRLMQCEGGAFIVGSTIRPVPVEMIGLQGGAQTVKLIPLLSRMPNETAMESAVVVRCEELFDSVHIKVSVTDPKILVRHLSTNGLAAYISLEIMLQADMINHIVTGA